MERSLMIKIFHVLWTVSKKEDGKELSGVQNA